MHRRLLHFVVLAAVAFTAAFFGYTISGHQKFTAHFLAALLHQGSTPAPDDATTTPDPGADSTSTPTLIDVLEELQNQEQTLTNQVTNLHSQLEVMNLITLSARTFKRGDSGDDVSKLQELLLKYSEAYPPETASSTAITGFYGRLTETAVRAFQKQVRLKQTGVVDQNTRKKLYELAARSISDEEALATVDPIDLSAVINNPVDNLKQTNLQNAITDLQNQISALTANASSTEADIEDLQNQISEITKNIANIRSGIAPTEIPSPPSPGPSSTTLPTTFPLLAISNIQSVHITGTSSTITWTSNNPATSKVDYSQNSSLPTSQTATTQNVTLVTNHSLLLPQLKSSTQYDYRVSSQDTTGAIASSTVFSFTTLK